MSPPDDLPPTVAKAPHRSTGQSPRDCPPASEWQAFLDGALAEEARRSLEQHYDGCAHCEAVLASLTDFSGFDLSREKRDSCRNPQLARKLLSFAIQYPPFAARRIVPLEAEPAPCLPGFTDLTLVGKGSSGTVYRAQQVSLNRTVAIKVLSAEALQRGRHRIRGEAHALARLRHPHIVAIHEMELVDQSAHIVMEWVAGGSLQNQIDQGPLDPLEVARLMCQLSEAIEAVHALGIIHRDLKPANVLLDGSSAAAPRIAKLTDFGLAQDETDDQHQAMPGTTVGTPSYMAPEQTGLVPELGVPGIACDLYGLGAVAFAALTGRPPHQGVSPLDTLVQVAWEVPPWIPELRPEVPVDLATIVAKCLRARPAERYRSAAELTTDLVHFLEGRPIAARPYSTWERLGKWILRRPAQAITAALFSLLLAALSLGITYHFWIQGRTLAALEIEKQKVDGALFQSQLAADAEKQARIQILQQLKLITPVTLKLLTSIPTVTEEQWETLHPVRQMFHSQVDTLNPHDAETAVALANWLGAMSITAERRFARMDAALEDLDLSLDIARRFTQSQEMRNLQAQFLFLRWDLTSRLNRPEEAARTLTELIDLSQTWATDPERPLGVEKEILVVSTLWRQGHLLSALALADTSLVRQRGLHKVQSPDSLALGGMIAMLSLQGQLRNSLGDFAGSEASFEEWFTAARANLQLRPDYISQFRRMEFNLLRWRLTNMVSTGQLEKIAELLRRAEELLSELHGAEKDTLPRLLDQIQLSNWILDLPASCLDPSLRQSFVEAPLALARVRLDIDPANEALRTAWESLNNHLKSVDATER